MSTVSYTISWKTRNRKLIRLTCAYLGIEPGMSVNRLTRVGQLTETQLQALQPLVQSGDISLLKFKKETHS